MIRALLLSCFVFALACGPSPDPTYLVQKPRIIGATYAVVGAPERASARPGESVRVEFLMTQKEEPVMNTWAIIICRPAATAFGIGFCEGEPLTVAIGATPTFDAPSFVVDVPEGPADDLLFIGAVCMGGQVNLDIDMNAADMSTNPCVGEGTGQLVTGDVFVREAGDDNLSPAIGEVRFDDEVWSAMPTESMSGCEGLDMPQIQTGTADEHRIEVDAVEGSREMYTDRSFDPPRETKEDLPVAFYASDLGISSLYSVIDGDPGDTAFEATPTAEIEYVTEEIEDPVEAGGRVVRFDIVMRDDRGGMDRVTRALCLLP